MTPVAPWVPSGRANLCISVASRPSEFGITVHNAGYRHLGLDFLYKAIKATDIAPVLEAVKTLNIRGCSVSMPFKTAAIDHVDRLDPLAAKIGAINTIVNDDGVLTGYNTDYDGALASLKNLGVDASSRVLVLGGGGVCRAVLAALADRGVTDICVAVRDQAKAKTLRDDFGIRLLDWDIREESAVDTLVNATPIGMAPHDSEIPVSSAFLGKVRAVFDVVASPPDTKLLAIAGQLGLKTAAGIDMTLLQAAKQFYHYTGHEAPLDIMRQAWQNKMMG